jgi:hypothetical protein
VSGLPDSVCAHAHQVSGLADSEWLVLDTSISAENSAIFQLFTGTFFRHYMIGRTEKQMKRTIINTEETQCQYRSEQLETISAHDGSNKNNNGIALSKQIHESN